MHFPQLGVQRGVFTFSFGFVRANQGVTQDCFHKVYGEEHMVVINHQLDPTSIVISYTGSQLDIKVQSCKVSKYFTWSKHSNQPIFNDE